MNIAVFIKSTTFHCNYGGLETQNKALCEGLAQRGHQVHVFSPQKELTVLEKQENGVVYTFVPAVYRLGFSKRKNNWLNKSYEKFKEFHEKGKFDLVISQSSAGLGIIQKKNVLQIKVISISHGTILGEWQTLLKSVSSLKDIFKLIPNSLFVLQVFFGRQRAFVHGSDKIIAVSNIVKKSLVDETFVDEHKVLVINNGISPFKFVQKSKLNEKAHLIYVGRIIRSKGLFVLVELLKKLDCVLNIVGDGADREELRRKVEKLGISDKVVFHGQILPDQVPEKLLAADIFVFPTLRMEGLPMVLVEAMFAALPIVAFDMGGVRDVLEDGVNGYLLPKNDYFSFEAKIRELIEKPDLRAKMAESSLNRAYQEFTLENMISKYEKIFMEVLTNENTKNSL